VWQRATTAGPEILEHYSLGDRFQAAAVPPCSQVLRLAREAGPTGRIAAVIRAPNQIVDLLPISGQPGLGAYGERTGALYLNSSTTLRDSVHVSLPGKYYIGVDGSFVGNLQLLVNGRSVASARNELNWPSEFEPFARVRLHAGVNRLVLHYDGPDLHPGSSGEPPFGLGPLLLGAHDQSAPVTYVPPSRAQTLCGKSLDWIEAIRF
jgi:hypothetical protein